MKNGLLLTFTLLNVVFMVGCSIATKEDQSEKGDLKNSLAPQTDFDRLLINERVPSFLSKTIDGQQIDSTYFKHKVTLLNFMYIGCKPCMEEAPLLNQLYHAISSPRFQMLCIAPETPQTMKQLHPHSFANYRVTGRQIPPAFIPYDIIAECSKADVLGHSTGPECRAISKKFLVSGYPVTLLVDMKGTIRYRHSGFSSANPPDLKAEIERLLNE